MRLPDGALIDERFRGMSTDQIYDLLKKEQDNPDNPDGPIDGPSGALSRTTARTQMRRYPSVR